MSNHSNIRCPGCGELVVRERADGRVTVRQKIVVVGGGKILAVCACGEEIDVTAVVRRRIVIDNPAVASVA